ncbi:MAG: choice-of-anchor N protein [Gammaproteobacteria bacterium]|nr:choice-of-anchor N protein [Gammaproteobacteria bacterium]
MKKLMFGAAMLLASSSVMAIPTLQVHALGSTAYDGTGDDDTWLVSTDGSVELELIGTYSPTTVVSIDNAYLVMTVAAHSGDFASQIGPFATRYDDSTAFETFLSTLDSDVSLNNHAPYGYPDDQIDIYALELDLMLPPSNTGIGFGTFSDIMETKDCNADIAGTTDCASTTATGEIKTVTMSPSSLVGIDWVHYDLVALVTDQHGNQSIVTTWDINPGSHDSTWTRASCTVDCGVTPPQELPAPQTLMLLGLGLVGMVAARRRQSV